MPRVSDDRLADAMLEALTLPTSELDVMGGRVAQRVASSLVTILQVRAMTMLLIESGSPRVAVASGTT